MNNIKKSNINNPQKHEIKKDKNYEKIKNDQDKVEKYHDQDEKYIQKNENELKKKLSDYKKKLYNIELRKLADIDNIKKNTKQKIKQIKENNINIFLKNIIPIINSIEEIINLSKKLQLKDTSVIQGIEMTLKSLFKILNKIGVKIEGKENELFNPDIQNVIAIKSSNTIPPNHIISINKKSLIFNKVLLRKADVIIAKK